MTHRTFAVSPSSSVYMWKPPQFFPQEALVQGTKQLAGELDKHRPGMTNISPLCLHGNIWPSEPHRVLHLFDCEPAHTAVCNQQPTAAIFYDELEDVKFWPAHICTVMSVCYQHLKKLCPVQFSNFGVTQNVMDGFPHRYSASGKYS